jgi:hypothetical protein
MSPLEITILTLIAINAIGIAAIAIVMPVANTERLERRAERRYEASKKNITDKLKANGLIR